jgi:hypothetical protein
MRLDGIGEAIVRTARSLGDRGRRVRASASAGALWLRRRPAVITTRAYESERVARFDARWHGGVVTAINTFMLTAILVAYLELHVTNLPASTLGPEWVSAVRLVERLDFAARMGVLERILIFAIPTTFGFGILSAALNALTPYGSPGLLLRLRGWDREWMRVPMLGYFVGRRSPLLTLVLPGIATTAAALMLAAVGQMQHLADHTAAPRPHVLSLGIALLFAALQYAAVLHLLFWLARMRSPSAASAHLGAEVTALLRHVANASHYTRHREPRVAGFAHVYEEQLHLQLLLEALGQVALLARRERQLASARAALDQLEDAQRQLDAITEPARLPAPFRAFRRQQPLRVDAPAVIDAAPLLDARARFPDRQTREVDEQNWWRPLVLRIFGDVLREGVRDRDRDTVENASQALLAIGNVRLPRPTQDTWSAVEGSAQSITLALQECDTEDTTAEYLLRQVAALLAPRQAAVDAKRWAELQGPGVARIALTLHDELVHESTRRRTAARELFVQAAWNARARTSIVTAVVIALAAAQNRGLTDVVRELYGFMSHLDPDGRAVHRGLSSRLLTPPLTLDVPSDVRAADLRATVALAASFDQRWRPAARAFARECRDHAGILRCAELIDANARAADASRWNARLYAL